MSNIYKKVIEQVIRLTDAVLLEKYILLMV